MEAMFCNRAMWCRAVGLCSFVIGLVSAGPATAAGIADVIDTLDPHPCYVGELTCVTITAPLDHNQPGDNRTLDIEFAVHRATGEHRGILIYFVGGPGAAGVAFGPVITPWFESSLLEHYDIVFFDQRGTGPDHGLSCVNASYEFWQQPWRGTDIDGMLADSAHFAVACAEETQRQDLLPFIDTAQSIRDVELFREAIGAPKLWLYGASYGTYIAQAYAARYPDAVSGVILDGVMDPAIDPAADGQGTAEAMEVIFDRMVRVCASDDYCRYSFVTDPSAAYRRLADQLDQSPIEVMFPVSDGALEQRLLTGELLFAALVMAGYSPFDRVAFLHALASSEYRNYAPLLRLAYRVTGVDPDTGGPLPTSETYFATYEAANMAIGCRDVLAKPANPDALARSSFMAAEELRSRFERSFRLVPGLIPTCSYWPALADAVELPPFVGGDYPTLIIASDTDVATPIGNARNVYVRSKNAYLLVVHNGPHVSYGWANECVDSIVHDLLIDGTVPTAGYQACDQPLFDPRYWVDVTAHLDPAQAPGIVWGAIIEANSAILTTGWTGLASLTVGCSYGGSLIMSDASLPEEAIYVQNYTLSQCRVWREVEITGSVTLRDTPAEWHWQVDVFVAGEHSGELTYRYDLDSGAETLKGMLDGAPVAYAD
jgi:pimeloyl-ACP methyl ester carboxylesterase